MELAQEGKTTLAGNIIKAKLFLLILTCKKHKYYIIVKLHTTYSKKNTTTTFARVDVNHLPLWTENSAGEIPKNVPLFIIG